MKVQYKGKLYNSCPVCRAPLFPPSSPYGNGEWTICDNGHYKSHGLWW